ncbi:MAG: hypothetical protein A2Y12_14085 [Planctomycetes bacterium GWF2_42_9]|nr:MAG: hypothetical protein A2Y12_14085 [Planctomycetes bacterium GWF2_42_9]
MYKFFICILLIGSISQAKIQTFYTDADAGNYGDTSYRDTTFGNTNTINLATSNYKRGFFHFDVSGIPTGSTINSAQLKVYVTWKQYDDPNNYIVNIYRVTNEWDELYLTWNQRKNGINWNTSGGDYYSTPVCNSLVLGNSTGFKTIADGNNFIQLVQDWVYGSIPNYGVVVMHPGSAGDKNKCV